MRLEVERLPYPMNRRGREACGFRNRAQAPVRRVSRRRLERLANDLSDLVVADLARRARTEFVVETIDATLREPPSPLAHCVGRSLHPQRNVFVLQPLRRQQNDPCALGQPLRRLSPRRQTSARSRSIRWQQPSCPSPILHESILAENRTYLSIRTLAGFGAHRARRYANRPAPRIKDRNALKDALFHWARAVA
jgi:hypothetical protein